MQQQHLLEWLQDTQVGQECPTYEELFEQYASRAHWLVRRTGAANAHRKQRFVYWKEHTDLISSWPTDNARAPPADSTRGNEGSTIETSAPPQQQTPSAFEESALALGRSLATSATQFDEGFAKPGDLTSVISDYSRVSTVLNPKGEKLVWSSPPSRLQGSKYFTCPYCKIICPQKYLSEDAWRLVSFQVVDSIALTLKG